jgi:hypothetical protein
MSLDKELHEFLSEIKSLRLMLRKEPNDRINKNSIRSRAEGISKTWFSQYKNYVLMKISIEVINEYDLLFEKLLKISAPNNLKKSYDDILTNIIKQFKDNIIIPITKNPTITQQPIFQSGNVNFFV